MATSDNSLTDIKRSRVAVLSSKSFAMNDYLAIELSHNFDVDLLIVSKTFTQKIKYIKKVLAKTHFLGFFYYAWQKFKEHIYLRKFVKEEFQLGRANVSKFEFKENSERLCVHLREIGYDFILLGKSGLLDKRVLQSGTFKFVNVHPAKLPEFRGYAEPAHALLMDRNSDVGFSIHWVDEGIDTGRIIEWIPLKYRKTANLTELLAWVRFQGFKHFLKNTNKSQIFFREHTKSRPSFPISTFLNWKIRRRLDLSIRRINLS
jgi:folate-dependent phosphoribosylglycinamide formyltransferase PurN